HDARIPSWEELGTAPADVAVTELRSLLAHEQLVVIMDGQEVKGVVTQEMYLAGLWGAIRCRRVPRRRDGSTQGHAAAKAAPRRRAPVPTRPGARAAAAPARPARPGRCATRRQGRRRRTRTPPSPERARRRRARGPTRP